MNKFVITIGRESGAAGLEIAKKLSKKLDVPYFNRDLLRIASEQSGINEHLFGQADESIPLSYAVKAMKEVYNGELLPPDSDDYTSTRNLFAFQAKVIKELANETSCIILGRAGNYLLKDQDHVLKVFLHAPLEWRWENVQQIELALTPREIMRRINAEDKRRGDYYKYYCGENWRDAAGYDLSIDVSVLGVEKTVQRIIDALPLFIKE